jgi:hypothetical protein
MSMRDRIIVVCRSCEKPYVARLDTDGKLILPVGGRQCPCGGEEFERLEADENSIHAAEGTLRAADGD